MSQIMKLASAVEGRVAQVINERELAINIGSEAGVTAGMRFAVLAESPLEIRDPISNAVLDVIDREKVRVEAREVRRLITVCRTYRTRSIGGSSVQAVLEMMRPPREVPESLRTSEALLPPPLLPDESYVKPNDRVVAIAD